MVPVSKPNPESGNPSEGPPHACPERAPPFDKLRASESKGVVQILHATQPFGELVFVMHREINRPDLHA